MFKRKALEKLKYWKEKKAPKGVFFNIGKIVHIAFLSVTDHSAGLLISLKPVG